MSFQKRSDETQLLDWSLIRLLNSEGNTRRQSGLDSQTPYLEEGKKNKEKTQRQGKGKRGEKRFEMWDSHPGQGEHAVKLSSAEKRLRSRKGAGLKKKKRPTPLLRLGGGVKMCSRDQCRPVGERVRVKFSSMHEAGCGSLTFQCKEASNPKRRHPAINPPIRGKTCQIF